MTVDQTLLDAIDGEWIAQKAEELVRTPSVTLHEKEVCDLYTRQLRDLGLTVDVREVTPGRSNLYASIPGKGGGQTLMLNGHLDTIPNQNNQPCFREGDLLYGRGTTDMKGAMASILGTARAFLETDVQLNGDLVLTAVVGHEEPEAEKDGPQALIADINSGRTHCDRIIIVEGPDALWVMSMGSMVFTITLDSHQGGTHTQYVPMSENPLRVVGDLLNRLCQFQGELNLTTSHPLAGPERIDLGIVHCGDYFNRIPREGTLTGTRRWCPGKEAPAVLAELQSLCDEVRAETSHQLRVSMEHEREPFETPVHDPIVAAVSKAHHRVTGSDAATVGKRIVGDANLYVHGSRVPTIYYGPSNETAHADVENVSLTRLESAAKVYALAALHYCGLAE